MTIRKGCGGAEPARSRINTFEPEWTHVFQQLCGLTSRTVLIQEIMGTEVSDQKIKDAGNRFFQEVGSKARRPRGKAKSTTANAFLSKEAERKDAAYLMGLYFGHYEKANAQGQGSDFKYYPRAVRLIATYNRYLTDVCDTSDPRDARISFETFYVMLTALSNQEIKRVKCRHCGCVTPATLIQASKPKCPVCESFGIDVHAAQEKLAARLRAKFDAKYAKAAGT